MKKQFITYYSSAVRQQLESGTNLEDIEVDLRLPTMKPLHAEWLVNVFNFITSDKGKEVAKGWKKAGVVDGTHHKTLLKLFIMARTISFMRLSVYPACKKKT